MTKDIQVEVQPQTKKQATTSKLILGLLFDFIGILSYIIPGIAETVDVIWAPISGVLLVAMYKGTIGKVAGVIGTLEELIPFTDFIPTFTLTWLYEYFQDKKNNAV
ncbi:hypothetical protein EQG63_11825 [Flavobacterium amnicola]|uniref:Uncharacterized protein n=1 Tax=Flavobacterium amnicola TaxID=2506422 RepID=A0A4Q1K1M6_9FLAO|nr:hypothetical protein [Flavobacterium amnicola]RXR16304.1 hypothetical protein EQG63_11825 [Flavobacterium amnicola]